MSLPIMFFHSGNAEYLKYSLRQARYFNPDSEIYLIGDKKNNKYPFVTHVQADEFTDATAKFRSIYKHRTTNSYNYELNCFLRWFYIGAFCKASHIERFIYLDSDVLAFQNFSKLLPFFKNYIIANTCADTGMPAFTYFKDQKVIEGFCDFLIKAYTDNEIIAELDELHRPYRENPTRMGGIPDMALFHLYFLEHPGETLKVDPINDELAVDSNITMDDGYEMENGMKKIYWKDNLPYGKNTTSGKLIRFVTLHYQGHAKNAMRLNYTAGGYHLANFIEAVDLKDKFKRVKKMLKKSFKKSTSA